jgi:hypothetical protein
MDENILIQIMVPILALGFVAHIAMGIIIMIGFMAIPVYFFLGFGDV